MPAFNISSDLEASFVDFGYYKQDGIVIAIPGGISPQLSSNLLLIILNTNTCDNRNIKLVSEPSDANEILKKLELDLKNARTIGKKVWIVGNSAPGGTHCNTKWAARYNWLIEAYQDVVAMQVFGGQAERDFHLQYPVNGTANPFGVVWSGPTASGYSKYPRAMVMAIYRDEAPKKYVPVQSYVYEFNYTKINSGVTDQTLYMTKMSILPDLFLN